MICIFTTLEVKGSSMQVSSLWKIGTRVERCLQKKFPAIICKSKDTHNLALGKFTLTHKMLQ